MFRIRHEWHVCSRKKLFHKSIQSRSQIGPRTHQSLSKIRTKIGAKSGQNQSKIDLGVVSGPISSEMGSMKEKKGPTIKSSNPFSGPENDTKFYFRATNYLKIVPEAFRRRFQERLKTGLNIEGSWDRFFIGFWAQHGSNLDPDKGSKRQVMLRYPKVRFSHACQYETHFF